MLDYCYIIIILLCSSVRTLSRISGDREIMALLKQCQQCLNHTLPLGAYLLKPVQRVLKYAMLLGVSIRSLVKNPHKILQGVHYKHKIL